jgi:hypothetical protein
MENERAGSAINCNPEKERRRLPGRENQRRGNGEDPH